MLATVFLIEEWILLEFNVMLPKRSLKYEVITFFEKLAEALGWLPDREIVSNENVEKCDWKL